MKSHSHTSKSWLAAGALAAAVLALLLFLELFDPWQGTLLWRELFNFGHVPLFGVVAVVLVKLVRVLAGERLSVTVQYAIAIIVAVSLAAFSEAVQIKGPRDADLFDFLSDIIGALSFMLIYFAEDQTARKSFAWLSSRRNRSLFRIAGGAILAVAVFPLASTAIAWLGRNEAYPVLYSFEHRWEGTFVDSDSATATVVVQEAPESIPINHVLRVDYLARPYTGLILQDLYPDWSSADSLTFEVTLLSHGQARLILRVEDVSTKPGTHDRFEQLLELKSGHNEFSFSLSQIQLAETGRRLDLRRIKRIVLFSASDPRREFSVEFDNFVLK